MSAMFAEPEELRPRHTDYLMEQEELDRQRDELQFRADDEYYDFPSFAVTFESRDRMLKKIAPELVAHPVFDINDIVDGLYSSVDTEESVPRLLEEMMEGLMTSYISCLHDFKVFVLHVGLRVSDVEQRTQRSRDFFVLEKPPVHSRSQVMNCLRKMRNHHHLTMMDPAVLWNTVVLSGCLRELKHKEQLLDLCPPDVYLDISDFITEHLNTYDWGPHCFLPSDQISIDVDDEDEPGSDTDLRSSITRELRNGVYNCLICCDAIEASSVFWPCSNCHRVFHIECIQDWCNSSVRANRSCPVCREAFSSSDLIARCWCKRQRDPQENGDNPGSCGQVCGAAVEHGRCSLVCHPGPHSA